MAYKVKQIKVYDLDPVLLRFIVDNGDHLNRIYGDKFNWSTGFPLKYFISNHLFLVCYKDENPVGFMLGSLQPMIFDINRVMLRQETLFAKNPRATIALMSYFIDFGKLRANYIVTNIGKHTNFKPASLEKLGFTKLQETYSMEV